LLTLINFLLFLINVFIKIISRVIVFGILAYSSGFIFFVIIVIAFSLVESGASLGKSKDIFSFRQSIFIIIAIMSVYLAFNHLEPFLAKIIKTMKTELNNNIKIGNLIKTQGQRYENEIINDKLLIKGLLKEIFNSIFATFKLTFIISLILATVNEVKSEEEINKLIEEYVLFSLSNLLIWLFSGIISFGIYEYLANIYIYNLYVALFVHFLIVGFWSIAFQKEGW